MRKNKLYIVVLLMLAVASCADCEKSIEMNVKPRAGHVKIDTIYSRWGDHASTAENKKYGSKILFNETDFVIGPEIGDSLVKIKGNADYILYTADSVYVQRFDCDKGRAIIVTSSHR
ncbi:MAG: hypothetical protein EOP52_14220 [Sphingobacteriales bacterium]|nr:MAG: hypothetical protein EOP52_14220 [Sphingobacteriales bacterium]